MPKDKILIVDDEDLIRWSLRKKISNWGYQTFEAANAKSAIEMAEKESPELILLDIRLPDVNGLELKEMITRQWPVYEDRVIFMTGDAVHQEENGDVIAKPFNLHSFERKVTEALGAK